jgi:hypothetical protein
LYRKGFIAWVPAEQITIVVPFAAGGPSAWRRADICAPPLVKKSLFGRSKQV